ncbi:MAG: tetratricopeptide repeat protein [Elusimicrobiota bacterium]
MPKKRARAGASGVRGKAAAVLAGTIAGLVLLESGLRLAGFLSGLPQALSNRPADADAAAYRIVTLGESTTAGGDNWPHLLERILNAQTKSRRYKVYNAAVPGTSTPFIVAELEGSLERYDPHLVITMMGINDDYDNLYWTAAPQGSLGAALRRLRLFKVGRRALLALRSRGAGPAAVMMDEQGRSALRRADAACRGADADRADALYRRLLETTRHADVVRAWSECRTRRAADGGDLVARSVRDIAPRDHALWLALGETHLQAGKLDLAERCLARAAELAPGTPRAYQRLAEVYRLKGASKRFIEKFLSRNLRYLRVGETRRASEVTRYHYRKLHEILRAGKVGYIAMQYPNKPVRELKEFLGDAEDVVFLGNESNFARALRQGRYEDYFTDRFAVVFGHATPAGRRLIAENAAAAVLRLVEGWSPAAAPGAEPGGFNVLDALILRHPGKADLHVDRAREALRGGDRAAAGAALARAEKLGLSGALAVRAARLYGELGDERRAFAAWNKAVPSGLLGADEWMERARAAESVKDAKAAAESLRRARALQTLPQQERQIERLAAKIPRLGERPSATSDPKQPAKLKPRPASDVSLWIERAVAAQRAGERDKALAQLAQAEKLTTDARWRGEIATLYGALGENRRALAVLERMVAAAPQDGGLRLRHAGLALGAGNLEAAAASRAQAAALSLTFAQRRRLALLYQEAKEFGRAAEILRRLAAERPEDAEFYREKGVCEFLDGSAERAIVDFQEAIRRAPKRLAAYRDLGSVYEGLGRRAEALATYGRALAVAAPAEDAAVGEMIRRSRDRLTKNPQ